MSYSSFCHYTIGVSLETIRPVDHAITTNIDKINTQHSYRPLVFSKIIKARTNTQFGNQELLLYPVDKKAANDPETSNEYKENITAATL